MHLWHLVKTVDMIFLLYIKHQIYSTLLSLEQRLKETEKITVLNVIGNNSSIRNKRIQSA